MVLANSVLSMPSVATKYIQPSLVGFSAACSASSPGLPIGPGGRPLFVYVLYGSGLLLISDSEMSISLWPRR